MAQGPLPSRPIYPHIPTTCSRPSCSIPLEFPLPTPQPPQRTVLDVKCWKCGTTFQHTFYPAQVPAHYAAYLSSGSGAASTSSTAPSGQASASTNRSRKIGTQDKPLETGYYDILGVSTDATTDDIKKAYRRLAIKHHPDKNPDDPTAAARFTQIGIAYQTLSDGALRKKYNEFGAKESQPEGGFVDPEEVFGAIFGGDRFVPIIGHIGLASDMKAAMQEDGDEENEGGKKIEQDPKLMTPEERAKKEEKDRVKAEKDRVRAAEKAAARAERVGKLVENLTRKLSIFTESATGPHDPDVSKSWKTICELEAEDLKRESYGVELLQAIGFVYVAKAKHHLATNQSFFGVGGWIHNVQGKYHVFSETVSTLRSAIELKAVFDQIAAAEKAGGLSPEQRKRLEEQAAEKGLQALFKGTKLEVESILREVCERVLTEPSITRQKAELRAVALQYLGEAYMGVRKDGETGAHLGAPGDTPLGGPNFTPQGPMEDEYVKIETKASKSRDRDSASKQNPNPRGW